MSLTHAQIAGLIEAAALREDLVVRSTQSSIHADTAAYTVVFGAPAFTHNEACRLMVGLEGLEVEHYAQPNVQHANGAHVRGQASGMDLYIYCNREEAAA